jgi:hypothetical protein
MKEFSNLCDFKIFMTRGRPGCGYELVAITSRNANPGLYFSNCKISRVEKFKPEPD